MQSLPLPLLSDKSLDLLATQSWVVLDQLIPKPLVQGLKALGLDKKETNQFRDAGIGRQRTLQVEKNIRGDQICWLDEKEQNSTISQWLEFTQQIQQELNQNLFLNINDFECHWACYPAGKGYDKHVDQHQTGLGQSERIISFVLYLNESWSDSDGGELVIYQKNEVQTKVRPEFGRLVLFRSDLVPHAVSTAQKERWSLTGWFRRRIL